MNATKLGTIKIAEADGVEILSLMDNSVDFLSAISRKEAQSFRQWTKKRHGQEWTKAHVELPSAEHGFSMLIRILQEDKTHCVLFDAGSSMDGMVKNAERMGIDLNEVESIVLSHGHYDPFGGLLSAVKAINRANLPVMVHPDAFKTRGTADAKGEIRVYPEFPAEELRHLTKMVETRQPLLFAENSAFVTGEILRETSFEKGYAQHKALIDGAWQSEPWIRDDQAIVINVKEKGLVVISGCAHAGIINTVLYAQQVTGVSRVYAVMGGFHLAGKEFEPRIKPTVQELKWVNPALIVPSHCTGWRATCALAEALPDAFVWNSVGNLYQL
ncbi:MAG: MBL fold metallo-hydrolase [Candidatus Bathyarchaeota archaeon]|nr:MBL fold metallo-hydrolase [Candidatus Bathyarchaeota archaeon]